MRKVEFFSSVFAQFSFGYQITSCFITQWLSNVRTVLSTCQAVPSLGERTEVNHCFLSFCRGDPTNSFLPAYPTDPISWTQVGGCHGGVNPLFIEVLDVFVLPWLSIHYSGRTGASCSLPDCICFCFLLQPMATTAKNSKVTSAVLVFHHVWSMYASCPTT